MTFQEIKKVKKGDCLTTKYGSILLVERVEAISPTIVHVFHYFDWDAKDNKLYMNEWLYGFYGPVFEEGFYRESTEEEKEFLLSKIYECGYMWDITSRQPIVTPEEFHRQCGTAQKVWHTSSDRPEDRKECLLYFRKGYPAVKALWFEDSGRFVSDNISPLLTQVTQWAYLEDLLPKSI